MRMFVRGIIIVTMVLPFWGCANASDCELPLEKMDSLLSGKVTAKLDSLGIHYTSLRDGRLCISLDRKDDVAKIMHEILLVSVPPNFSVSLDEPVQELVIQELKIKKIPFHIRELSGFSYIVWQPEHSDLVKRIINEKDAEYSDVWFEKNK